MKNISSNIVGNSISKSTKKVSRFSLGRSHWELTAMLVPGIFLVFVFCYLPMIGIIISFKDFKYNLGMLKSPWVGFDNFRFIFESDTFLQLLRNTVCYNLAFIVIGMVFAIFVALCLDRLSNKFSIKVFQSSMFLPYFLSWVVVAYISYSFLAVDNGIINNILGHIGLKRISFYSEKQYWPFILTSFNLWKGIGFNTLVYYGTILSIDASIFEAASIDGCSQFRKIIHVTIPHLSQTVTILTLLSIGGIFHSDYGLFFYLPRDSGALYAVTDVMDTYILRALRISGSMGGASAVGFLQSIVGFLLVVGANWCVRKLDEENALF